MLFLPLGAILAVLAFMLFRVSLHGFLTFVPSLVYAAYATPWRPKD